MTNESVKGLDTEFLCKAFKIKMPLENNNYTAVRYARSAIPGCAALIRRSSKSSPKQQARIAIRKGASLIITDEQIEDFPCLIIPKLGREYIPFWREYRQLFNAISVGITGSVGKTTASRMISTVMHYNFDRKVISSRTQNVYLGAIKNIQKLKKETEFLVQEIAESSTFMKDINATSSSKNPTITSRLINPKFAVITKISDSHLEYFKTIDNVINACFSIQRGMDSDGILFLNADDELQRGVDTYVPVKTYGIINNADYRGINIKTDKSGTSFDVSYGDKQVNLKLNCFGEYNVLNALACFGVCIEAGLNYEDIREGLLNFKTGGIRQNLVNIDGYSIFLDCYNASVESIDSSFRALGLISKEGLNRNIAVLGGISDISGHEDKVYADMATIINKHSPEIVILSGYGFPYLKITQSLINKDIKVLYSEDREEIKKFITETITKEDILMVKGSRAAQMETLIDEIFKTNFGKPFKPTNQPTNITALSAVLMDFKTLKILYSKDEHTKRPMASTTKIITCLLAIEEANLDDIVIISKLASSQRGSRMNLQEGEKIKLGYLLYSLMLRSSNDAAVAIAEHISGSVEKFVNLMNIRAEKIGALNTNFKNPHGLDADGHFSTAYDMAIITREALKNESLVKIVGTRQVDIVSNINKYSLMNSNKLLGKIEGVYGVKTGMTKKGRGCLVSAIKKDKNNLIIVVLGSTSRSQRFKDTESILSLYRY